MITLGQLTDHRPVIAAAVGSGTVNPAQALAIGHVLDDVAPEDPAILDKVEAILIDHATQFEPAILRRLGERALAHIQPDLADARLRDRLDREERHAHQRRGITLAPDGLGATRISGLLDTEGAAIIAAAIEPLTRPVRDDTGPDHRSAPARRADALIEVCRIALAAGGLPEHGGTPPQLNVTVNLDALTGDWLGLAASNGLKVSIGERKSCYDNAVIESWFASLKNEEIYPKGNPFTRTEARARLFAYIWDHNNRRLHSTLGYVTPRNYPAQPTTCP